MLQTVAAVCVGVVAAIFIYYVTNKESPQKTSTSNKENSTYAEFYDLGKGLGEDKCPICQDPLPAEPTMTTNCGHKLHRSCFRECKENGLRNCPVCRSLF